MIERSSDLFGAYAENVKGVTGCGNTIDEAKQSVQETIRIIKEQHNSENIPDILKGDYEVVYRFDLQSVLEYYKGIFTPSALQRIAGINQKQLQYYSAGLKKPRLGQRKRIEEAFHNMGRELISIELK